MRTGYGEGVICVEQDWGLDPEVADEVVMGITADECWLD